MDDEALGVVGAHDLAPVVDAVGRRLEDGVRVVDRRELAAVQEIPGPERVDGIVRDAAQRWWGLVLLRGSGRAAAGSAQVVCGRSSCEGRCSWWAVRGVTHGPTQSGSADPIFRDGHRQSAVPPRTCA